MSKIAEELIKAYEPTEEDLKKELSYDELVELCKRTRCRVDMWKWNVVDDFAQIYRENGRFDGRSRKFMNKLLIKTYHRRKKFFDENEKELPEKRRIEWEYRKKESLLRLGLWRYEEEMKRKEMEKELVETPEILTLPSNTESLQCTKGDIQGVKPQYEEFLEIASSPVEFLNCEECLIDDYLTETEDQGCGDNDDKDSNYIVNDAAGDDAEYSSNLQNHAIAKDLMNCNSESVTVETFSVSNAHSQGLTSNGKVSEANLVLSLSQLRENTLEFLGTEIQTQTQTYEDFTQKIPQSSTQDATA